AIHSLRNAASSAFSPVRDSADGVFSPVSDAWNGLFHYNKVEKENARLRARIEELEGQAAQNADAAKQLADLQAVNNITAFTNLPAVTAQVTAGPLTKF